MSTNLTKSERLALAKCEKLIQKGLATFFEVGGALIEIRSKVLHRETHETFEGYCADVWGFSRSRAYQLITAAETAADVSTIVDIRPDREAHVRPLLGVPKDHRGEVWQMAVDAAERDADGKPVITARLVQDAVDRWHDGRKCVPERVDVPEATSEVIDVECRPVGGDADDRGQDQEDPEEQDEDLVDDPDTDSETCPECGSPEIDEDKEGRYCKACKATIEEYEPEQEEEQSDDAALFSTTEDAWREQYAGRLEVAAVRLETLAANLREDA